MADLVRVNGNDLSWGSIIVKVGDVPFYGFTEVSYGDKRTREYGYGLGRHHAPRSKSAGKYEPDMLVIKGHKRSVSALLDALQALAEQQGFSSFADAQFQTVVQYIENDAEHTDIIDGCTVESVKDAHTEGPGLLMQDIEARPMTVERDGKVMFSRSAQ